MAWLPTFSKRKPITITGGASGAQTDFQLDLAVVYAAAMQSDFDDLRFTQADGTTLIDAWLETKVNDDSADVVAEFPTTPANTVEQTYYMYYGNGSAVNYWDIAATFIAGYDFSTFSGWDGDTARCTANQTYQGKTRCLQCNDNSSSSFAVKDDVSFPSAFIIECNIAEDCDYYSMVCAGNVAQALRMGWVFRSDYISYYWDGSSYTYTNIDPVVDTWYKAKLVAKGGTGSVVDMYIDDVLKLSNKTLSSAPTFLRLAFVGGSGQGNGYYNDLRVRKYASGPATYAFGSEESAPAVGAIMNQFQKCNIGADLYNGAIIA